MKRFDSSQDQFFSLKTYIMEYVHEMFCWCTADVAINGGKPTCCLAGVDSWLSRFDSPVLYECDRQTDRYGYVATCLQWQDHRRTLETLNPTFPKPYMGFAENW